MHNTLIQNTTLLHLDPPRVERGDIRIRGGRIAEIGQGLAQNDGESVVKGARTWVMPGLVCAHTHLYSALACGMPGPRKPIDSFTTLLEEIWWRLDKALDLEGVEVSALVGGVQALRSGVTTLVDHHASPNAIDGSLESIDTALGSLGLRRVLCYEVTDRDGAERARAGLRAHADLLARGPTEHRAVMVGAHANFTLSDETLRACGDMAREAGVGLHIHVAEAADDRIAVGEPLIARMDRLGALLPGSLLAHCVHLDKDEIARIADAGAWISHQPRSNMNNAVGRAPLQLLGPKTLLGTDGIGADMFGELQAGWYRASEDNVGWSPARWLEVLTTGADFAGNQLGVQIGKIEPGAAADLVFLDPIPGPPLTGDNLAAAWIFRFNANMVRDVMIDGQWRLRDRMPVGVDAIDLDTRAQTVSEAIWSRF